MMGSTTPLRDYFPALLFIEEKITLRAVPGQRAWQSRDPLDSFNSGLNFTAHLILASWAMHHKTKPRPSEVTSPTSHLLNSSREYIVRPWSLGRANELLYWISPLQWQVFHKHITETLARQLHNNLQSLFLGSIKVYILSRDYRDLCLPFLWELGSAQYWHPNMSPAMIYFLLQSICYCF